MSFSEVSSAAKACSMFRDAEAYATPSSSVEPSHGTSNTLVADSSRGAETSQVVGFEGWHQGRAFVARKVSLVAVVE
eukprot:291389-Amorphochlora_amoeboformis.AAC.1